MQTEEMLEELLKKAKVDMSLRQKLFDTRNEKNPVSAFCKTCRELGYEIYDMDLISAGEEFYATMRRSTNGGCWHQYQQQQVPTSQRLSLPT